MSVRSAALTMVALVHLFAATNLAEAQRQKGKLGGGAGFAWLSNPEIDHGSTAVVGGFIGYRFNDNVSLESGLYFARSNRVFNEFGVPVDQEPTPRTPAFRFETTRYHADGAFVLNLGRRQPFHPFVLVGGGVERRDNQQTDFVFGTDPTTGLELILESNVVLNETEYVPTAIFGGGAEIYFMYNLAARAEVRLWVPKSWDDRTFALFFAATYYF